MQPPALPFRTRRGRDPADLSRRFAAHLGEGDAIAESPAMLLPATLLPGVLVGAEHEYQVVDAAEPSTRVDFRTVIHGLGLGRPRLDPDDPYGYHLRSGNVVTCDEAEAEIALAPRPALPGSSMGLVRDADRERRALQAILPTGLELRGHSTHVSVGVPTELGEPVGWLFAQAFAADLMRIVASPDRCGVWVRPRPDRLELCLDFVAGDRLAAATTFVVAATAACLGDVIGGRRETLPPLLRVVARSPRERSGWHLARRAFGGDPFDPDGSAPLALVGGGTMTAAEHLATAWQAVRGLARGTASDEEAALLDALVEEPATLPIDRPSADRRSFHLAGADLSRASGASAYGDALVARARPGYEVGLVALTWGFAVYLVLRSRHWLRRERRAFACVPNRHLETFLRRLDSGALDPLLGAYLSSPEGTRSLGLREQTTFPGLFDRIGPRRALLPLEPQVAQPRLVPSAAVA